MTICLTGNLNSNQICLWGKKLGLHCILGNIIVIISKNYCIETKSKSKILIYHFTILIQNIWVLESNKFTEFFLNALNIIWQKFWIDFLKKLENASMIIFYAIFTLKLRITRCRLLEGQSNVTFLRNIFFFYFFSFKKIHIEYWYICVVLDVCKWEYIVRTFDRFDNSFFDEK